MTWLKEQWFKAGTLAAIALVAFSVFYSLVLKPPPQSRLIAETPKPAPLATSVIGPDAALRASFTEATKRSAMADIAELSCFPERRYDCGPNGCVPVAPATYYFVDYGTESATYFRCDAKGCDSYRVAVVSSGIFRQFVPLSQAMIFKVNTDEATGSKGEFIDIATIGTSSLISFGTCQSTAGR